MGSVSAGRGLFAEVEGPEGRLQLVGLSLGQVPGQQRALSLESLHQLGSQAAGQARVEVLLGPGLGQDGLRRPVAVEVQEHAQSAQHVAGLAQEGGEAHHEELR